MDMQSCQAYLLKTLVIYSESYVINCVPVWANELSILFLLPRYFAKLKLSYITLPCYHDYVGFIIYMLKGESTDNSLQWTDYSGLWGLNTKFRNSLSNSIKILIGVLIKNNLVLYYLRKFGEMCILVTLNNLHVCELTYTSLFVCFTILLPFKHCSLCNNCIQQIRFIYCKVCLLQNYIV